MTPDEPANPGELREDIPLRPNDSAGFSHKFGGIRLIIASFTILTIAVTIALATQIYYGDFEIVPHGSVATDSQECSRIGTDMLKAGGNAVDAAIAAAFCLSVINQHTTGLDAGGVIMMYDYRNSRSVGNNPPPPIVVDFSESLDTSNIPQLVRGLAFLHVNFGILTWRELVEPAIQLARFGFSVPTSLVAAIETTGATELFPAIEPGHNFTIPLLASYLDKIAYGNVTTYFVHGNNSDITTSEASFLALEDFVIYTPSTESATTMFKYLRIPWGDNSSTDNYNNPDTVYRRAHNLRTVIENRITSGPASNVAVIDKNDYYVSLITGLHVLLGSQRLSSNGYIVNEPASIPTPKAKGFNSFVPVIITQHYTCGQRIVLSCGEMSGTLQVLQSLVEQRQHSPSQLVSALENPRLRLLNIQTLAFEKSHSPRFDDVVLQALRSLSPLTVAPEPYPTCNAVQQIGDSLSSHADSRGGGIASRF